MDFNTTIKSLIKASATKPSALTVPALHYLMVDGRGDPNTSKDFQNTIQALYGTAYTLKFGRKKAGKGPDFRVPPLEGLYWFPGNRPLFDAKAKGTLQWTLMLALPDFITKKDITDAVQTVAQKHPNPLLAKLRFERFAEGKAVQVLYVGPYSAEKPTIERLTAFAKAEGLAFRGKHHEIYLSDPRRTPASRLKTVLRHPVA